MTGSLDPSASAGNSAGNAQREESALNMFRQMDLKGSRKDDTQLKTIHQNTISRIREYAGDGGNVSQLSTTGVDGRVVVWSV